MVLKSFCSWKMATASIFFHTYNKMDSCTKPDLYHIWFAVDVGTLFYNTTINRVWIG